MTRRTLREHGCTWRSGEALDAKSWRAQLPGVAGPALLLALLGGTARVAARIGRGHGHGTARDPGRERRGHGAGTAGARRRGTAGNVPGDGGSAGSARSPLPIERPPCPHHSSIRAPTCLHAAAAGSPAVVGVAGGVGTSTVAAALGGLDLGVFTGRPADVVVCRATVASVLRAGRVAALCGRPVVAVTAVDTGKPSSALRSRLALLEPHTAAVVALPWVPQWRDLVDPLQQLHDQLAQPAGQLPRPVGGYLAGVAAIHAALASRMNSSAALDSPARDSSALDSSALDSSALGSPAPGAPVVRSPAPPGRPHRTPPPPEQGGAEQVIAEQVIAEQVIAGRFAGAGGRA